LSQKEELEVQESIALVLSNELTNYFFQ